MAHDNTDDAVKSPKRNLSTVQVMPEGKAYYAEGHFMNGGPFGPYDETKPMWSPGNNQGYVKKKNRK